MAIPDPEAGNLLRTGPGCQEGAKDRAGHQHPDRSARSCVREGAKEWRALCSNCVDIRPTGTRAPSVEAAAFRRSGVFVYSWIKCVGMYL